MTGPPEPISDTNVRSGTLPWVLIILIAICTVIETVLQVADLGLIQPSRLRVISYEYFGFWSGLLRSWIPNYPLQPYLMFVTYGFLHGGLLHLVINMITLWSLGGAVIDRVGVRGFVLLYVAALMGGAAGFALLASTLAPMVGASGALFGLAGGLLAWGYVDRFTLRMALWPVVRAAGLLLTLNLVMWWALNGQLAWQTHLGGFVMGWISALIIDPRAQEFEM